VAFLSKEQASFLIKSGFVLAVLGKRKRYQNNRIFHLTATILGVIFECKLSRWKK